MRRTVLAAALAAGLAGPLSVPVTAAPAVVADVDNDGDTETFVNDPTLEWGTWVRRVEEARTPCDLLPDPPRRQCEFVWRRISTTESIGTNDVNAFLQTFDIDGNGQLDIIVVSSTGGRPFTVADVDEDGDPDVWWLG